MARPTERLNRIVLIASLVVDLWRTRVLITWLQKMSEVKVKQELAAIGLDWVRTESYLPRQYVLIFKRPTAQREGRNCFAKVITALL